MAEYVILTNSDKGHRISGFAHSVVPSGDNAAGTPWSQALIEYLESTVSQVPSSVLPAGRQTELDSGLKYEWPFTVDVNAHATPATKQGEVEAELVELEPDILTKLQNRLQFWGKTGSV